MCPATYLSYPDCSGTNIYQFTYVPACQHNPISSSVLYHLDDPSFIALQRKLLCHEQTQFYICVWVRAPPSPAQWIHAFCIDGAAPCSCFCVRKIENINKRFSMSPSWLSNVSIENDKHANRLFHQDDNSFLNTTTTPITNTSPPPTTIRDSRADWLVEKSAINCKELWVASLQQINGPLLIEFGHQAKLLKRLKQNQTKQWGFVSWFSCFYSVSVFGGVFSASWLLEMLWNEQWTKTQITF